MPIPEILDILVSAPAGGEITIVVADPDADPVAVVVPTPEPVQVTVANALNGEPGVDASLPVVIFLPPVSGPGGTPGAVGDSLILRSLIVRMTDESLMERRLFYNPSAADPFYSDGDLTRANYSADDGCWLVENDDVLYRSPAAAATDDPTLLDFSETFRGGTAAEYPVLSHYPDELWECTQQEPPGWRRVSDLPMIRRTAAQGPPVDERTYTSEPGQLCLVGDLTEPYSLGGPWALFVSTNASAYQWQAFQGPAGAPGAPGAPGTAGGTGANAETVVLTLAAYLALDAPTQMDGRWYVIPK